MCMLFRALPFRVHSARSSLKQMAAATSNGATMATSNEPLSGCSLQDLPKSNVFTSTLPPDQQYPTPFSSHNTPRGNLGPRMVKGALYTYVRPEHPDSPELLGVSGAALRDIGLKDGQETSEVFRSVVAGNKIFWDEDSKEGIYPWAQCYGGQLGPLCSQRAVS